jgi:NAD-dependent dihydropyrimidine dehydrogenase PreA subunit
MVRIEIHANACRGCRECVDICPTDVFELDEQSHESRVINADDCIACLSCAYVCPAGAITHADYHAVKNFYRDLSFCQTMEKYL